MSLDASAFHGIAEVNPALYGELADNLYANYPAAFREYVANGWDADSVKSVITISSQRITVEDWGSGIQDIKKFWEMGNPHKKDLETTPVLQRPYIGAKGIGKLAYRKLGLSVRVTSRATNQALYSDFDFATGEYDGRYYANWNDALPHRGTKIEISKLVREVSEDEVMQYLKNYLYGLMQPIASPNTIRIMINEKPVDPEPLEKKFPKASPVKIPTTYGDIGGLLGSSEKGCVIDVLNKGIKISEITPTPLVPVRGYLLVNWLTPTTDRNSFIVDTSDYKQFYDTVRLYVQSNFPSHQSLISIKTRKSMKVLAQIVGNVANEMALLPTLKQSDLEVLSSSAEVTPIGAFEKQTPHMPKYKTVQEEFKPKQRNVLKEVHFTDVLSEEQTSVRYQVKSKPIKTGYGIIWLKENLGPDNPAVVVDTDSGIICFNGDHKLLMEIDSLPPQQQLVALSHLCARGYAYLVGPRKTKSDIIRLSDELTTALLKKITSD